MRLRAPDLEDAPGVFAVLCERDLAYFGVPDSTLEDVLEEWGASDFDLSSDARLCEDEGGRILGYASVRLPGTYTATVPRRDDLAPERLLLDWAEQRQRELGWDTHRQAVPSSNGSAKLLLESVGYTKIRSHWRMRLSLDERLQTPEIPRGLSFRPPDPVVDAEVLHKLDRASFATVAEALPESVEHFTEHHLRARDLDVSLSAVALRGQNPLGFLLARRSRQEGSGFVDILAVAPSEQGKGLGSALLQRAFVMFKRAGLASAQLGVAGDNPKALRLYERVGMSRRFRIDAYERPVQ